MSILFASQAAPQVGGSSFMLYLTAAATLAALVYLGYAMIRPERF